MRILVIGAAGSGTTTLGQALSARLGCQHLDLDDYFWVPSTPPYQQKRDATERLQMLLHDLHAADHAVASGSLMGWGQDAEDAFDLTVFLTVPTPLRLARIQQREVQRFGSTNPAFLTWASQYDEGPPGGRSLAKHESWLAQRRCLVLRIAGDTSVGERVERVLALAGSTTAQLNFNHPERDR